jgi:NADH:ubiquinone oxidoreductase subunit 5 (subunit L)/multisubunit Na+/H+ antiporter MnhA subunit
MVAAGAYLLVRLAPHLDSVTWFASAAIGIGLTSSLAGGVVAAVHRHPKRLLAASTTAQYGLMFVAVGVGSTFAAAAHLAAHAAFKSLLFLTAGTAMNAARSDDIGQMQLGRRLPEVGAFAAIGALALAALPPLGGAWSKDQITGAAFEFSYALGTAVLVAAFLSAFYAFRYWVLAFGPGRSGPRDATPTQIRASIGFLALLCLALAALWVPAVSETAAELTAGRVVSIRPLELSLGLASLTLAAGFVVALRRRNRLVQRVLPPMVSAAAAGWFGLNPVTQRIVVAPVLAMSRGLAAFDDRVIDAGIRASARIASALSSLLRRRSEISIDAIVNGIGGRTLLAATGTRTADDHGVDRAAEGVARGLGRAGDLSRRLQSGLSHDYYVIVAVGLIALVAALAMSTS